MEDGGAPKGEGPVAIAIFATIVSPALVQGRDNSNVIQSPSVAYGYFTSGTFIDGWNGGVKWSFILVNIYRDVTLWRFDSSAFLFAFTKFWSWSETPSSLWLLITVSILWHPNTCYENVCFNAFFRFFMSLDSGRQMNNLLCSPA